MENSIRSIPLAVAATNVNFVDFHNHHIPARFAQAVVRASPAMQRAGLSDDEQNAIAAGNCLRLLGIG